MEKRSFAFSLVCILFLFGCTKKSDSPVKAETLSPGSSALSAKLLRSIKDEKKKRGPGYRPRTRHLKADGSAKYTNRLFLETSPYLRQHAHNPVNWYPWGEEAFATAKRLKRPILLSIGYSTCHWCHVMEEESFEDMEIARVLNENYVAIKVDREERPDIDAIYMAAVQAITGRGGWPSTLWLTPDKDPYYGATYIPARDGDRGSSIGFITILRRLKGLFDAEPEKIAAAAHQITTAIRTNLEPKADGKFPLRYSLHEAAHQLEKSYDSKYGGTKRAPKFPSTFPIRFLLRYFHRSKSDRYRDMAVHTASRMAAGGMYDQIGGGFHRYSTDEKWLVPHFEKMLYDNALLTLDYLEAFQVTKKNEFKKVVVEILAYAEREMSSPDGGFYSATDADSVTPGGKREEGYFFTWTPGELEKVLGKRSARHLASFYGVSPAGNFEGRSILYRPHPLAKAAKVLKLSPAQLEKNISEAKVKLYAHRSQRPMPLRDEKILTAWNGLMISAFAKAAFVLNRPSLAKRAGRAAEFILEKMVKRGRLRRSFYEGRTQVDGYLEDYAFFISGLLDLFEVSGELRWLNEAERLQSVLEKYYGDPVQGAYFLTANDHEKLLLREKPTHDGAEPSGNSVAALNLLRLHEFTSREMYLKRAKATLRYFGKRLERAPTSLSELLLAVDYYYDEPKEIAILIPKGERYSNPLLDTVRSHYVPNRAMVIAEVGENLQAQSGRVAWLRKKTLRKGKATAYVCIRGLCELPTTDPKVLAKQLAKVKGY